MRCVPLNGPYNSIQTIPIYGTSSPRRAQNRKPWSSVDKSMKRCPKCNRTYTTGNQKFCTHDGGLLEVVPPSQSETIRISSQLKDTIEEAPTRAISRELTAESTGQFDPFKTVMARPEETTGGRGRNTGELAPPSPSAPFSPAPTSASLPPLPSGSLPASDSGTLPSL